MAKHPVKTRLEKAVALHREGRFADAEKLYDQILALNRQNFDALNLKGVVASTLGRYREALVLFDRAESARPNSPVVAFNRGLAFAKLGMHDEALNSYAQAIALDSHYADARLNQGLILYEMGKIENAVAAFRAMTKAVPSDARGFYNLGVCLEQLLPTTPEHERASRAEESRAAFTGALSLAPHYPEAHFAFANLHHFLGEYEDAIKQLQRAIALRPEWADAWQNLGSQFEALGRREEAIAAFDRAIALNPADAAAVVNRGMACLALGRLAEGWEGYGRRFEDKRFPFVRRDWPWATWRGEELRGKAILIWSDQGIGDEVMYASMVREISARARVCVLECAPRLAPLYRRSFPGLEVVANTAETQAQLRGRAFDYQSSVLDLGRWLRPKLSTYPNPAGLLAADSVRAAALRRKYQEIAGRRPLIGISWRSITPDMAHQKGQPLEAFAPLLTSENFTFVSLQYGDVSAEVAGLSTAHKARIIVDSEVDSLKTLDDFAAQVAAMDAVVTISNSTAHFAGALQVPTCLLLPRGRKQLWYWFHDGRFSPWYRAIRVYRAAFETAILAVREDLEGCAFARASREGPPHRSEATVD